MSYWDTPCPIKLYIPELDSQIFRDFLSAVAACEAECLLSGPGPAEGLTPTTFHYFTRVQLPPSQ